MASVSEIIFQQAEWVRRHGKRLNPIFELQRIEPWKLMVQITLKLNKLQPYTWNLNLMEGAGWSLAQKNE